jgi:hypothetical protein
MTFPRHTPNTPNAFPPEKHGSKLYSTVQYGTAQASIHQEGRKHLPDHNNPIPHRRTHFLVRQTRKGEKKAVAQFLSKSARLSQTHRSLAPRTPLSTAPPAITNSQISKSFSLCNLFFFFFLHAYVNHALVHIRVSVKFVVDGPD